MDHGPQFDRFPSVTGQLHGGSHFDEFGKPEKAAGAHGRLMDTFARRQRVDEHGPLWDEGWKAMPDRPHGERFDSDFATPVALDGSTDHGTWNDVFTAGTEVRYVYEGKTAEGTVLNVDGTEGVMFVRPSKGGANGGGRHEVSLPQVEAFRQLAEDAPHLKATPGDTPAAWERSTAEAPSAHDATAHGGPRESADATKSVPAGFSFVAKGTSIDPKTSAPSGCSCGHGGTFELRRSSNWHCASCGKHVATEKLHKSLDEVLDVMKGGPTHAYAVRQGKIVMGPWCKNCAKTATGALTGGSMAVHTVSKAGPTLACKSCGKKVASKVVGKIAGDEAFDVEKTDAIAEEHDVAKTAVGYKVAAYNGEHGKLFCSGCASAAQSYKSSMRGAKVQELRKGSGRGTAYDAPHRGGACSSCGTHIKADTASWGTGRIAKAVDSTETAIQGDTSKTVGHRSSCPRGGSGPCGADVGGKCSICSAQVRDHEAIGKSLDGTLDVLKGIAG